jgi:hypothetical protein
LILFAKDKEVVVSQCVCKEFVHELGLFNVMLDWEEVKEVSKGFFVVGYEFRLVLKDFT